MKVVSLSRICPKVDSVDSRKAVYGVKRNQVLLEKCASDYENLRQFREDRDRAKRYTYGDQWGDYITYKGKTITEKSYIKSQGNIPLVNNLIRRLVNNVVGVYVKSNTEPICTARDRDEQKVSEMMTITLQCNWQVNKMPDLLSVMFEDFLVGGAVFAREKFAFVNDNRDSWTDICNPNYMFFNSTMKDPRHWDISRIGEIHDITFNELCSSFAHSNEDYMFLKDQYKTESNINSYPAVQDATNRHKLNGITFYGTTDPTLCRVYEIWTKEIKARYRCHDPLKAELYKIDIEDLEYEKMENQRRIEEGLNAGLSMEEIPLIRFEYFIDNYWYYQFLTPQGYVLDEGETPFHHKSHPYTLKLYPFVNGEIHSFVSDVIDQQRYINRMITLNDFVTRTGAKGVTMVPDEVIPDWMTPEEFAEQWTSVDGIIFYTPKPGVPQPQQFYSKATNLGTAEMIQLQMGLMEDISSVHNALQGKTPYSGTSAALYSQQTANSTTSLANILMRFTSFVEELAIKKVKMIQQFYNEKRIVNISGKNYAGIKEYDPEKARDIQFDMSIKESASTPAFRMVLNDSLMEFWRAGAITLEQLLENGDFPFSDQLLQSIQSAKESGQLSPEMMEQVQAAANQNSVTNAQQMMMK